MASPEDGAGRDVVPVPQLDARVRNLGDKVLVAGPEQVLELADTAVFVWKHIDGRRTVGEIGEALAAEYDIDAETATEDVAELVQELVEGQIVRLR
jgi:Coenzyme PQQ synthesis protein D (PqqD)